MKVLIYTAINALLLFEVCFTGVFGIGIATLASLLGGNAGTPLGGAGALTGAGALGGISASGGAGLSSLGAAGTAGMAGQANLRDDVIGLQLVRKGGRISDGDGVFMRLLTRPGEVRSS